MESKISRQIKEQYQIQQESTSTLMTEYFKNEWFPITKQALLAHNEIASHIKSIHASQNRFERSLLTKTVEALHKREEVSIKKHWTFGKKLLFIWLIIVAALAIITLLIRQGHLDLLNSLWQTAWQKFNG